MPIGAVRGRISKKAASISVWRRSRALTAIPEGPSWACRRRSLTAPHPIRNWQASLSKSNVATPDGLKAIDADVSIGVSALKTLSEEMAAQNPRIQMTYENAKNGEVMPNIPQMSKFWSFSMATAFQIATNGQASPQAALDDAKKNMEK